MKMLIKDQKHFVMVWSKEIRGHVIVARDLDRKAAMAMRNEFRKTTPFAHALTHNFLAKYEG